jgi:CheY-like chemotaxis protein
MSIATKVLLADDDEDDREIFSEALASIDADVQYEGVEDGQEAIDALLGNQTRPHIIFLDINMPVMNGWDVLRKLKSDNLDIPVIMYSTSSGENEKRTAFDLGALCFITKPESVKLIKAMLEVVITRVKNNQVTPQMCREIQRILRQA